MLRLLFAEFLECLWGEEGTNYDGIEAVVQLRFCFSSAIMQRSRQYFV
jgi:hypothetical protein